MNPNQIITGRLRLFFLPLLLGTISVFIFLVITFPQINQIGIDRANLADRKKTSSLLQAKIAALSAIDETSQMVSLETAVKALPLDPPYPQALDLINFLSQIHQLAISELKLTQASGTIEMDFSVSAPLERLQAFLDDVATTMPVTVVRNLTLVNSADQSPIASVAAVPVTAADFKLAISWKQPPATIGKPSDPLPVISASLVTVNDRIKEFKLPGTTQDLPGFDQLPPAASLFPE